MNIKTILLFISGVAIGGAAGVLGSKRYFQNKYQKQYEEDHDALEEYYHRTDEYLRRSEEEEETENEVNPIEEDSKPGGRMTPEERSKIKERLNQNWKGSTNYSGMYREKGGYTEEKLAEGEHPLDQVENGEEESICENCSYYDYDYDNGYCNLVEESVNRDDSCSDFVSSLSENSDYTPEEEAFDENQKNKNKPPKIISSEAYANLPSYVDQDVLYFYSYDEILCDDNEDPVEEPERLIGDALTKYDFTNSDERIIFVMNYALDTCYEIQKVDASWEDTH